MEKTEVIIFGPDHIASKLEPFIGPLASNIKSTARNLGISFDSKLNFEPRVHIQSCYLPKLNQL